MMCVCIHTYIRASSLIYVRMLIRTCSCTCMLVCSYPRTLVHVRLHVPLPLHVGVGVEALACIRSRAALTPYPPLVYPPWSSTPSLARDRGYLFDEARRCLRGWPRTRAGRLDCPTRAPTPCPQGLLLATPSGRVSGTHPGCRYFVSRPIRRNVSTCIVIHRYSLSVDTLS